MNFLVSNSSRYNTWMEDIDQLFDAKQMHGQMLDSTVDIEDSEKYTLMSFDLPGMKTKDLSVKVEGDQLIISGERKRDDGKSEKSQIVFNQRRYGKFHKVYSLSETLDAKKMEADYRDGVLRIFIPKIEVKKPDVFEVQVKGKGEPTFLDRLSESTRQH